MAFRFLERTFPSFEFPTRPSVQTIDERIAAIDPDVREELIRRGRALARREQQFIQLSRLRDEQYTLEQQIRAEQQVREVRQAVHGHSPCCTPERSAFDSEAEYREAYARAQLAQAGIGYFRIAPPGEPEPEPQSEPEPELELVEA